MTTPASNLADGNLKVSWVSAIADPTAPTALELNAGIDLTCYLTPDGFSPGGDEQVVNDSRLCSRQDYEKPGRSTDTLSLTYVFRGQEAIGTDNEAFHTLTHLAEGYVVTRWGTDYEADFAAADVVDVIPAQAGKQMKQPPEANSVLKIGQRIFVTGEVQRDVAVV